MIFRRPLTIVFGALPATWLAIFAGMAVYAGGLALVAWITTGVFHTLLLAILLTCWGVLGLYGTMSLWAVGLGFTGELWRDGLKAGIVAAFPILISVMVFGNFDLSASAALLATAVAIFWLVEFPRWPSSELDDDDLETQLDELKRRGTSW